VFPDKVESRIKMREKLVEGIFFNTTLIACQQQFYGLK